MTENTAKTKVLIVESLPCSRKPADLDQAVVDGFGQISVAVAYWKRRTAFDVRIEAHGGYAEWTDEELRNEATYILSN